MDVDRQSCGSVVLLDFLTHQNIAPLDPETTIYVSVLTKDPTEATLESLRLIHRKTLPQSAINTNQSGAAPIPGWSFQISEVWRPTREYEATANLYCGNACAGTWYYRLKKDGSSCKVLSRRLGVIA
jgi:hypothetical protein